jgi:hypothetical protein
MTRVLWFLMVLLTLITAPALCQTGMLEHECACLPGLSECSHEARCAEDPCGWLAAATWRAVPQTPSPSVASLSPFWARRALVRLTLPMNRRELRFDLLRRSIENTTTVLVV